MGDRSSIVMHLTTNINKSPCTIMGRKQDSDDVSFLLMQQCFPQCLYVWVMFIGVAERKSPHGQPARLSSLESSVAPTALEVEDSTCAWYLQSEPAVTMAMATVEHLVKCRNHLCRQISNFTCHLSPSTCSFSHLPNDTNFLTLSWNYLLLITFFLLCFEITM